MLGGIGSTELIVIFLVILIFFGANKIPELARGLGQGMNEFKKASDNLKREFDEGKKSLYESAPKKEEATTKEKKEAVKEEQEKSTEK